MESAISYPHSVLGLPSLSSFGNPKLGRSFFSLKEIADGPSLIISQSIRADGNRRGRPPRRNSESGDDNKKPQSSDGKISNSSNQEEIIALFRRIQSSISKGESISSKKRSSNSSGEKPYAESVLEVLRQSQKQVKENVPNKEGSKVLTQRKRVLRKEELVEEVKLARPPSNFVKRSPIPSPPAFSERAEVEPKSAGEELEEMKLPALKQLAKSRGIKGYSKLKKSELVELLRS